MIELRILKSEAGKENCFELSFMFKDYLPKSENSCGWSEYDYYTWLFTKHNLIIGNPNGKTIIYCITWECEINGIRFHMVYDEDYDFMTFSVDEENIPKIQEIGNAIMKLIEQESN